MLNQETDKVLSSLAESYFTLLARSLPVCCLSDEFHYMPRAESARFHLSRTDRLEKEHLLEICGKVRAMKSALGSPPGAGDGTRTGLLRQNMEGFLQHVDTLRVWERDPALYLKVAWIGLDLALRLPGFGTEERADLFRARLRAVQPLLVWGERQLSRVPGTAREASLEMVAACRDFLKRIGSGNGSPRADGKGGRTTAAGGFAGAFLQGVENQKLGDAMRRESVEALEALDRFERFVRETGGPAVWFTGREMFREVLQRGYGWEGGLREAREILDGEAAGVEADLKALARRIEPGTDWNALYRRAGLPTGAYRDPVSLYRDEMKRLESFFRGLGVLPVPPPGSAHVETTPSYLEPVRATASYSAPPYPEAVSGGGRFFVMGIKSGLPEGDRVSLLDSLHRDYRYLTAHETVPGHHLLDWARLHLEDPVRRQIESAFFYEGWACYAEQLVDECGFDPRPIQQLIRKRRELWRAVRGRLDAGLQTGEITVEQAAESLQAVGSGSMQARKQARRITLTPGYQLCYTLGKHGFQDLRRRFVPPMTLKAFHETVLSSGQAPFPCLERECST